MCCFESELALPFSTKAKLPNATVSDTLRLAPTTHLEERFLPIGDELAESPLVSKSRKSK
jgi:hypothetical protein